MLKKILYRTALAFFILITGTAQAMGQDNGSLFDKIEIIGESNRNGLFDISIEYDDSGVGWLAYSRVELPKYVETHLAKSTDHGKTWAYIGVLNQSSTATGIIDQNPQVGVWRYETPALLFDPGDIPARRWKLFVHRYFTTPPYKPADRDFETGWIEYKYAAMPDGSWSDGVCLFGKRKNNCQVDLNSLHPDLSEINHYSELGSIVNDGIIYISLDASNTASGLGDWKHRKIVLVASHDHGANWRYIGTLTDYNDADALGYLVLTGSSLTKEAGKLFALLTPSGAKGLFRKNRAHDGTLLVEFADIRKAKLKRDANGELVVLKTIKPSLTSGGLSDYDEQNAEGGLLFSQINLRSKPEVFQIFSTYERLDNKDTYVGH